MQARRACGGWAWVPFAALVAATAACAPAGKPAEAPGGGSSGFVPANLSTFVPASLAAPVPDDPHTVKLASTIRKVTVFSDRALVTREAATKVATEPTVYAFKHLPGWVDEGSVRAA